MRQTRPRVPPRRQRHPPGPSRGQAARESRYKQPQITSSQHRYREWQGCWRSRERSRRRGDARCRPDPAPPRCTLCLKPSPFPRCLRGCKDQQTRRRGRSTPAPAAGRARSAAPPAQGSPRPQRGSAPQAGPAERPAPGTAPPRTGTVCVGVLLACPRRAAPPLPFLVPPAGRPTCTAPRRPPTFLPPLPRGWKPGREQPPERSSPSAPRTGTGSTSYLPPTDPQGAPPDPWHPLARGCSATPVPFASHRSSIRRREEFLPPAIFPSKCCPRRRRDRGREGGSRSCLRSRGRKGRRHRRPPTRGTKRLQKQ